MSQTENDHTRLEAASAAPTSDRSAPGTTSPSTIIPSIGITFAEASRKAGELLREHDDLAGAQPEADVLDDLFDAADDLHEAVLSNTPVTLVDALAVLDRVLCPSKGLPAGLPTDLELRAMTSVRALLAAMTQAEQATTADDFAETVALFTAAGPATLSIPQAPTDAMVEAGAAAAGITPEAFRTGYAAAIEAFARGIAA